MIITNNHQNKNWKDVLNLLTSIFVFSENSYTEALSIRQEVKIGYKIDKNDHYNMKYTAYYLAKIINGIERRRGYIADLNEINEIDLKTLADYATIGGEKQTIFEKTAFDNNNIIKCKTQIYPDNNKSPVKIKARSQDGCDNEGNPVTHKRISGVGSNQNDQYATWLDDINGLLSGCLDKKIIVQYEGNHFDVFPKKLDKIKELSERIVLVNVN